MTDKMKSICIYCGSSEGNHSAHKSAALQLADELIKGRLSLIYGGAGIGLMGSIADAVLDAGGEVIGVIPKQLYRKEVAHPNLSRLEVVANMHERKARMMELSDGFVALSGGLGTLEEIFESLTWLQLGIHQKPCAILNTLNYYDSLLEFLDNAVQQGFIRAAHLEQLIVKTSATELIAELRAFEPNYRAKWAEQ